MGTRDYLEWDIYEWSKVLKFWSKSYNKLIAGVENSDSFYVLMILLIVFLLKNLKCQ